MPTQPRRLYELTDAMTVGGRPAGLRDQQPRAAGQESRHNLTYWRYGDYAGDRPRRARPAARTCARCGTASRRISCPRSRRNGHGIAEEAPLSAVEAADEALVMGLRLREGIDAAAIAERFGLPSIVDWQRVERLVGSGHLRRDGARIAPTAKGRLLLDHILGEIAAARLLGLRRLR